MLGIINMIMLKAIAVHMNKLSQYILKNVLFPRRYEIIHWAVEVFQLLKANSDNASWHLLSSYVPKNLHTLFGCDGKNLGSDTKYLVLFLSSDNFYLPM